MAASQDPAEINEKGRSLHPNGASTGLQHLKPGGSVWNSRHQLNREAYRLCNSSLCATAERSSANENAQRQSGSSVAPQRKTPGVTAQTLPSRHQDSRKQTSSSLQLSRPKGNCQQRKSASESLSSEQTGNQNHVHSRTVKQQSTHPSPVQEIQPPTDVEIDDFIAKQVEQYRTTQSSEKLPALVDNSKDGKVDDRLQLQRTVAAAARKQNDDKKLREVAAVSRTPKHTAGKVEGASRRKPVGSVGRATGNQSLNENQDTFPNRRKTSADQATSSVDQIQIHNVISMSASGPRAMDAVSAVPQGLPQPPANKNLENTVRDLRDPKYEDISDYEESEAETTRPDKEDGTRSPMPSLKNPQYEDISEDENPEKEEQNKKQEGGHGHTQGPAQLQTASTSDEKLVLLDAAQRDDGLCPKCDCERQQGVQTHHSASCPLACDDLKDGDESDEDMVLPISITNILYGPEYEEQHSPENISQNDGKSREERGHCDTVAASSYNIEVFDTLQSFLQAKGNGSEMAPGRSVIEHEMMHDKDAYLPSRSALRSEPEDSSETDDSCNYSVSLPPEAGAHASGKQTEHSKATNEQNVHCRHLNVASCQDSADESIEPTTVRQASGNQNVIIVDSDSEDESDRNCSRKAKRKRSLSSGSNEFGHQKTGHPPETVDSLYGTADLSVPQCPEPMQSKAAKADHKHVQHVESVIILDSDSGDDSEPNPRQENSGRLVSSGFKNSDILPCNDQKRHSPDSVDREYGRTKEKRLPSAERPALSLCAEYGGRVQHSSNKQTTTRVQVFHHSGNQISRTRATERNLPAAPKQTGQPQGHVHSLCGTGNTRPRQTILLTEEPQRKTLQSRSKKAEAASGTRRRRLRLPSSAACCGVEAVPKEDRNLAGERVDGTPAATSTNASSRETNNNTLKPRRVSRVPSVPNPKPHTKMVADRRTMPGPSHSDRAPKRRPRASSHDSVTPLMKRSMSEAKHLTNARNREIQREQRCSVGAGYKWLEKKAARLTKKGSSSEG